MKNNFKLLWSQISWLWFLPITVLVIGVGFQNILNPIRFPVNFDYLKLSFVLFSLVLLLGFLFKGWLLGCVVALATGAFIIIPLFNADTAGTIWVTAWIGMTAYLSGDFLLKKLSPRENFPFLDRLALSFAFGIALLMIISSALGFVRLYYSLSAWLILGVISILLLPGKVKEIFSWFFSIKKSNWLVQLPDIRLVSWSLAIVIFCGLGAYLWALAPAVRYDSLSYHIPVPLNNISSHAITEMPENIQSYWSHYAESLFTLGLLIDPSTSLPGMLHFQAGSLVTLFTFVLGRKFGDVSQGVIAAVLFWSLPIIQMEIGSAYIDLYPAVFVCAAIYSIWLWAEKDEKKWLLIAGFLGGMGIGVKLTAVFPIGLMAVFILIKNLEQGEPIYSTFQLAAWFALPVLLVASPWLLRDWAWTGNPIFPSYNQIFQSPKAFGIGSYEFKTDVFQLRKLISFPKDLLISSKNYYHELPGFAFGGIPLFSLPILYPWSSKSGKQRSRFVLLGYVILIILISQQISRNFRYLIYIFPILTLLASENFLLLWRAFRRRRAKKLMTLYFLGFSSLYLITTQMAVTVQQIYISERYPYKYALGLETAEHFLSRAFPQYRAFQFLETQEPAAKKVLSLGNEFRLYTTARIFGPLFSKEAYEILHTSPNSETLAESLDELGYTHILLNKSEIDYRPQIYKAAALDNQFLYEHTQIIYVDNFVRIFSLNDFPSYPGSLPKNLLQNHSFEELALKGLPQYWEFVGEPIISTDGSLARTGKVSISITGPSITGAFQNVSVNENKFYTVSYWAKPQDDNQILQLFVMWLDENKEIIDQSANMVELQSGWHNYQGTFKSSSGAHYARMAVTTASPGVTWFDDLCFIAGGVCP